jgi:predicted metal-dependent enzyme (double-stranded beta helix superfamily)
MVGQLRGEEKGTPYHQQSDGSYKPGIPVICSPGHVDIVSPNTHDIHEVANNHADQTSISIHVYGANIGKVQRTVYDAITGQEKNFISGYANTSAPNLWANSH